MDGSSAPSAELAELLVTTAKSEHGFVPLRVEGVLPPSLVGTLYRTGPGAFEAGGTRVSHIFEGDGAISSVRFGQGGAEGAYRFIQSEGRKHELEENKALYGFALPWHRRFYNALTGKVKNTGNTSVMAHQERLFALMEGSVPTEIDPNTLATIGETRFEGEIKGAFSAHPHRIPARRCTYNFGLRYGRETFIDLYALPDVGLPTHMASVLLAQPVMLHDFIATENHLVFFVSPLRVVIWRALLQLGGFGDLFRYEPSAGTEVIIVPIDRPSAPRRFTVDAFYQWHFANAYETGEKLVVDFVRYPNADTLHSISVTELGGGELVRAQVGLSKDTFTMNVLEDTDGDFPLVDPRFAGREHGVVFRAVESDTGIGVARTDVRMGKSDFFFDDARCHYSEPVFVPKSASAREGEGHLLSLVLDARTRKSHIAVLDAEHVSDGPVAKAFFDHAIPMTFHGTFVPR